MKPNISDTAGGYLFEWENEKVQIRTTHLHLHQRDGKLTGEIRITTTAEGCKPHLSQCVYNFSALRTRKELAKVLSGLLTVDWETILEQLSVYTLERYRGGEPSREIWGTADAVSPPEFLLSPLLIKNYANVIFGEPGTFKSGLAMVFCGCVRIPWVDNPLGLGVRESPVNVIWLDWETDEATMAWTLTRIRNGTGLQFPVTYRPCALPLADDLEKVNQLVTDARSSSEVLLVLDSLSLAAGGELKEAETALKFFAALRKLKCTSLIIAHPNKEQVREKKIYGSIFFEAQARNIWELKKSCEDGEDRIDVGMFHRKAPPFSKICKPMGFSIHFTPESIRVEPENPKEVGQFLTLMSHETQIMMALKHGKLNYSELAQETGIAETSIRKAMSRLIAKKKAVRIDGGYYGLSATEYLQNQPATEAMFHDRPM